MDRLINRMNQLTMKTAAGAAMGHDETQNIKIPTCAGSFCANHPELSRQPMQISTMSIDINDKVCDGWMQ